MRALNLVGAVVPTQPGSSLAHIGPAFMEQLGLACGEDLRAEFASRRAFIAAMTAKPLAPEVTERILAFYMVMRLQVRSAVLTRGSKPDWTVAEIDVPVLVSHGAQDAVVLPAAGQYVLDHCPVARPSWYDAVGHMPFAEDPARFNRELAAPAGKP